MKVIYAALLLAKAVPSILASAAQVENGATNTVSLRGKDENRRIDSAKIISHPLLPHREVLNRRRLELNFDESWMPEEEEGSRRNLGEGPRHQQLGALYQGYGTHYVDLWVGKPIPQRQTVIVDTGSSVTAFPCSNCHNCGESYHTDGYFAIGESETYRVTDCGSSSCTMGYCTPPTEGYSHKVCSIRMSYAEGSSWSAIEATDVVYAGGMHDGAVSPDEEENVDVEDNFGDSPRDAYGFGFDLKFGCQYSITGLFISQLADGIMGMEVSSNSFWKQMYSAGAIDEKKFSLCFGRQPTASREGTEAGAMTLGGTDERLHQTPMLYAANVHSSGFYTVYVKAMYLRSNGGESALPDSSEQIAENIGASASALNYGNIIVDSGTTDTYLPRSLYEMFASLWKKMTGMSYTNNAVELSHDELLSLPTVLFQLEAHSESIDEDLDPKTTPGLAGLVDPEHPNDLIIAVPASHYMEYDPKTGKYTSRIYLSESSGGVLGANTMMGHDILFDDENSRIGFAESHCDYMSIIEEAAAPTRI